MIYSLQTSAYLHYREAAAIPRRRLAQGLTIEEIVQLSDDLPAITKDDMLAAVRNTRPTVSEDLVHRHQSWSDSFGCEY